MSNAAVPLLVLKAPETPWLMVLLVDHTIGQVEASADFGTEVHHLKSCPPNTANPGLEEFPDAIIPFRKLTAWALMVNAWAWKIIWIRQWTSEKTK